MQNKAQKAKLIVTIIRRPMTKKMVEAIKNAGATGSTILYGSGIKGKEKSRVLGIPITRERDIILTLASEELATTLLNTIYETGHLDRPKTGICFVIDVGQVVGTHLLTTENTNEGVAKMTNEEKQYDLIVTIVNKGDAETVIEASRNAGADGGTIISGRGTGIHEQIKLFNMAIEPEKELVLTLVPRNIKDKVLSAINENERLDEPGKGIAFVLEVEKVLGINHEVNNKIRQKLQEIDQ